MTAIWWAIIAFLAGFIFGMFVGVVMFSGEDEDE